MADNTELASVTGGDVIASDDIGGVKFPRSKIVIGADGVNDGDVSATNPLPVLVASQPIQVTGPTITWAAPTFATVTATSSVALAANSSRRGALLVNDSTQEIFLSLRTGSPAVVGSGLRLNANGGSYEINNTNLTLDAISAIAANGSNNLTVHEAT